MRSDIDADGEKHVLGIWLAKTPLDHATASESARFWTSAMTDLKTAACATSSSPAPTPTA
ncbi:MULTISPECIES: hypothetical protein [unclassified Nonomuraea]|uniref:hypothetical protein n=1 Tax=unclassified Nonomuraea TaxID=2593643 RepID=UPI0033FCF4F6